MTGKDLAGGLWRIRRGKEREGEGYWEVEGVPIHLTDVVNPNQEFSVSHYYRLAWMVIKNIWQRKKLPILVGGTGFYIKAVIDGILTKDIPRNPTLRRTLEKKTTKELFVSLQLLDPFRAASMNVSDRHNPRRLLRALEVVRWREGHRGWSPPKHETPEALFLGLTAPYEFLYPKIDGRIDGWIKEGAEEEMKKLLSKYRFESSVLGETLGYWEWKPYFEGKATLPEVVKRWKYNEHHYARRQLTWFRKDHRINWFDISRPRWENEVEAQVATWY